MAVNLGRLGNCFAIAFVLALTGCAFSVGGSGQSDMTPMQRGARTILHDKFGMPMRLPDEVPDEVIYVGPSSFWASGSDETLIEEKTLIEEVWISFRHQGTYFVCYGTPDDCSVHVGHVVRQVAADEGGPITVIHQSSGVGEASGDTSLVTESVTDDVLQDFWTNTTFVTNPTWLVELADEP